MQSERCNGSSPPQQNISFVCPFCQNDIDVRRDKTNVNIGGDVLGPQRVAIDSTHLGRVFEYRTLGVRRAAHTFEFGEYILATGKAVCPWTRVELSVEDIVRLDRMLAIVRRQMNLTMRTNLLARCFHPSWRSYDAQIVEHDELRDVLCEWRDSFTLQAEELNRTIMMVCASETSDTVDVMEQLGTLVNLASAFYEVGFSFICRTLTRLHAENVGALNPGGELSSSPQIGRECKMSFALLCYQSLAADYGVIYARMPIESGIADGVPERPTEPRLELENGDIIRNTTHTLRRWLADRDERLDSIE